MVKRIILIIAIAMIAFSGVALADTATVNVTANVVGTCKFNFDTTTLGFGQVDPSSTSDATAQTIQSFWCTKNTAVATLTAGNGLNYAGGSRNMENIDGDPIPYALTLTAASNTGLGKTTPINLTIDGTILNADFVDAAAGAYSDSVTIEITP